jgi:hypothetical protein
MGLTVGAKWGAIVSRHSATQSVLKRSIAAINQAASDSSRRQSTGSVSFASKGQMFRDRMQEVSLSLTYVS